jgi:multiple sugar transport system ATP-binding protein
MGFAREVADRVVVMNRGRVHQVGTPEACYRHPVDTFVATFLGSPAMNMVAVRVEAGALVFEDGDRAAVAPDLARLLGTRPGAPLVAGIRPRTAWRTVSARPPLATLKGRPPGHEN